MKTADIRQGFIDFFESKEHRFVRSAPVVPFDDPTLLFTNAGMNQFKPIFLGESDPEFLRVVNSQKCIRVSGKHNDLEEVGLDAFHHTFFEMLGNWSFGDYYKAEAIQWSWELFTDVWGLDKNRLWASVYKDDDEAFDLWTEVTDIAHDRVLRFGKKDNFWEMGETGPCGPCSEIHYFVGSDPEKQSSAGVNANDEYWELWNLVFIQSERHEDGSLSDLPAKHVDTGAGLERIACVLQGKTSNYDTDLFLPIIEKLEELAGSSYEKDPVPHRVIADHIRMLCFAIADGALPSNEGRGYVLRRILRRAARFGRNLDLHEPFLYKLVPAVGDIMGDTFPEVVEKLTHLELVIGTEETSFNQTLDRGLSHFDKMVVGLGGKEISGAEAFRLYDTYGFPLDLTQLMAREQGLSVDGSGFDEAMAAQRQQGRESGKFQRDAQALDWDVVSEGEDSKFLGYETLKSQADIRRYAVSNGQTLVVLDRTPFYAESGGQVGDTGRIESAGVDLAVLDVQKDGESFIHICSGSLDGQALKGSAVTCTVDGTRRQHIRRNHTATHLLHAALKQVLGDHVQQAGSLVHPDYLRFDLTYFEKITPDHIVEIENIVNEEILLNRELRVSVKAFDEAKKEGVVAMFGEKYGDRVRVVAAGDFSKELCGGTHVDRTGDIGLFKITEESSLAAGVRRMVAVTGKHAVSLAQKQTETLTDLQSLLNCATDQLSERVEKLLADRKDLGKKLKQRQALDGSDISGWVANADRVGEYQFVLELADAADLDNLKQLGDQLLSKIKSGIGILFYTGEKKPSAVVVVTRDLNERGLKAGSLAKEIGALMGGGGGGKPHLATAGGRDLQLVKVAMESTRELVRGKLNNL